MTNARFAQKAARIAAMTASWSADVIDTPLPEAPMSDEMVKRFVAQVHERLEWMLAEIDQ